MKVFLLWQSKNDGGDGGPDPATVGERLLARFAPLFETPPSLAIHDLPHASFVALDIPLDGWTAELEQRDAARTVFAIDPPINGEHALRRAGVTSSSSDRLLRLAETLESDPKSVLRELAPNASILWANHQSQTTAIQTDGLGHAQLFEYDDPSITVVTNRVQALAALGLDLEPIPEEWATRFTLGWFPLFTSGFRGVETMRGGTQLRFGADGVTREVHDVLSEWVHPDPMSRDDAMELGVQSLVDMCDAAISQWERPSVGLSGGFDSRAIVSILRHRGSDMDMRVRGHPERLDVLIANQLAEIAGLPLRIKPHGGMPPETIDDIRRSFTRALLWQSGGIHLKKHLTYRVRGGFNRGGVNVMGSHAGIVKADFAVTVDAANRPESEWEPALLEHFLASRPVSLLEEHHDPVREGVLSAIRAADAYDLEGVHKLHFFFLHEYTRRWAAGAINGAIDLVFTPFLNPDLIRAAYAFPAEELPRKPFHREVVARFAPDWKDIPYDSELTRDDKDLFPPVKLTKGKQAYVDGGTERWRPGDGGYRIFHRKFFWRDVGKPLMNEANKDPRSFTREIFDPETMRPKYKKCPDAIAVAHLLPEVIAGKSPVASANAPSQPTETAPDA